MAFGVENLRIANLGVSRPDLPVPPRRGRVAFPTLRRLAVLIESHFFACHDSPLNLLY